MIEFDVRLTSDGALVLMHDETVDRTTDGRGAVADMTLAQLRRLDAGRFKHPKFAGTSIPTFEETLAMMPRNIWLNCHMKGGAGLGIASARAIMKENRQPQAFLAAETDAAKGARSIESDILICDMERTQKVEEYVNHAISTQAAFIQFVKSYDVPREAIAELKRHHVRVNYYLADSADEVRTLFQAGVDFPLVNDVRAYMPVAWEIGIAPLRPRW
jgi:glycerophosphoryl diester phosphodiesterase